MREIKFRAWNGSKMRGVTKNDFFSLRNDGACSMQLPDSDFEPPIMQFIGRKDFDGSEIYEDDILRAFHFHNENGRPNYLHHIVKWSEKLNGWFMLNAESMDENDGSLQAWVYFKNRYDATVIGNIHENPELICAKK